jgi:glycosyltransferase involved in cell wall biosynthesis
MTHANNLLSILIPSRKRREPHLINLLNSLRYHPDVTVSVDMNERMTIGAKRNTMIRNAKTEYVVFIDDDDHVSEDYIDLIIEALQTKPDVVGISGWMTFAGEHRIPWKISKDLPYRYEDGMYLRHTNHLCPIKTSIACAAGYPPKRFGEDYAYAMRLKAQGLIKTEVFIDKEIYHYDYRGTFHQNFLQ